MRHLFIGMSGFNYKDWKSIILEPAIACPAYVEFSSVKAVSPGR